MSAEIRDRSRCPSSGENVGRMIEIPGSDEWKIRCPTCGALWFGGSTVLDEHRRPWEPDAADPTRGRVNPAS